MKTIKTMEKGITLVALVVTIVVLITLAGVSINLLIGNNGIITKAQEARRVQEIAEITSQIQLEIASKEMEKLENREEITEAEVEEILEKFGTVNKNDDETVRSLMPNGKDYEISYEEIYDRVVKLPTDGSYSEEKKVNTPKINEEQGMKLVTYNTNKKEWVEDTRKTSYSYVAGVGTQDNTKSKWANATVTMNGIESYFVWIPRYAYKITYYTDASKTTVSEANVGYGSIDVKFIKGTGVEASDGTICKFADDSTLTANDYIIHPAFTQNADLGGGFGELSGLWIGKFETSRSSATIQGEGEATTLKVVPNVKTFGATTSGANVGDIYTYAKEYNKNLKSHMLKNSEWGVVAYLAYSKYGRNGNEIAVNQCLGFITGAGPGEGNSNIYNSMYDYNSEDFETKYSYTTEQGKKASTTGNEYGVYDMVGGNFEYVASYYNQSTALDSGSTFATKDGKSTEYATAYIGRTASINYIKGDATYETSGWNSDAGAFAIMDYPFFLRSGSCEYEDKSGIFYYFYTNAKGGAAFRMCLCVL